MRGDGTLGLGSGTLTNTGTLAPGHLSPAGVALQIAEPLPVRSKDEFGQVTEAFNAVHLEAVRTAAEQAARRVVDANVINGEKTAEGVRPAHIKDRIRALGPTVRPDLTLKPADPNAGNWVI